VALICGILSVGCGPVVHEEQLARIRSGEQDTLYPMSPADLDALLAEPETAARVEHVHFTDADSRSEDYSRIAELQNLRIVTLYSATNTDSVVTTLDSLERIEELGFYETDLSDSGLGQILMPGLRELSVNGE
jgi:hypothetical protein